MDDLRSKVLDIHPDAKFHSREELEQGLALGTQRRTRPYFTPFEWTTIIATRVQQLKSGAQPLIGIEDLAAGPDLEYRIAEKEAMHQKLPFIIMRSWRGAQEFWSTQELTRIH